MPGNPMKRSRCKTCKRFSCECSGSRLRRDNAVKNKQYGKMPKKG